MLKVKVFDLTQEDKIIDLTRSNIWKGYKYYYAQKPHLNNNLTKKLKQSTKQKNLSQQKKTTTTKLTHYKTDKQTKRLLNKYKTNIKIYTNSKKRLNGIITRYDEKKQIGQITDTKTHQIVYFKAQHVWDYAFLLPRLKTPLVQYQLKLSRNGFCKAHKIQFARKYQKNIKMVTTTSRLLQKS